MTSEHLLVFSLALGIAAMIPGPGIIAMVARALGSGFWPAMPMAFGMILGDLIFLTSVVLGVAAIAKQLGGFFTVVKFVGAAYLIYLGCRLWMAPLEERDIAKTRATRPIKMVILGLIVTLSNPKAILFYLALAPNIIDVQAIDSLSLVELGLVAVIVDATALGLHAAAAARTRLLFLSSTLRRRLNRCAGASLIGAGAAN